MFIFYVRSDHSWHLYTSITLFQVFFFYFYLFIFYLFIFLGQTSRREIKEVVILISLSI